MNSYVMRLLKPSIMFYGYVSMGYAWYLTAKYVKLTYIVNDPEVELENALATVGMKTFIAMYFACSCLAFILLTLWESNGQQKKSKGTGG